MKKLIFAAAVLAIAAPAVAKQTSVRGYVRNDGTYVQPHQQTAPNSTKADNWSTKGNVNPYTGKQGTVDPYAPPKPNW